MFPFPVLKEDPYQIDLLKTEELIDTHQPELIVLGKSMILYREPVNEIARMISGMNPKPIIDVRYGSRPRFDRSLLSGTPSWRERTSLPDPRIRPFSDPREE